MLNCSAKIISACLIVSVLLFIGSLVLAFIVFPDLSANLPDDLADLSNGSDKFKHFMNPQVDNFKVYIFQVINGDQVLSGDQPYPILQEIGPFVYRRKREKELIAINDATLTYKETQSFTFDASASGHLLTKDSKVKVLNFPLMALLYGTEEDDPSRLPTTKQCLAKSFENGLGDVFIEVPISQLLFDGINFNNIIKPVTACESVRDYINIQTSLWRNIKKNDQNDNLKFSYFQYKTEKRDTFTMKRGLDNNATGEIIKWNDQYETNYWANGTICNSVHGNNGILYHTHLIENSLTIFSSDFCRTFNINFLFEDSYNGIQCNSFMPDESTFTSPDPRKDCFSSCYNQQKKDYASDKCYLDGVLDLQKCSGSPILLSFPHFLWSNNSKYLNYNEAMNVTKPSELLHVSKFLIEPNTGTLLRGLNRYQLNTVLRPILGLENYTKLPTTMLPLLWVEEEISVNDEYFDNYFNTLKLYDGLRWSFIAVTALMVIGFSACLVYRKLFY